MEQKLPSVWKFVDITPLSKVKQVLDPKKELWPISLTSAFSKIAEDFLVSDCIKQAFKRVVDLNQFGNISGSSTVLALITMVYKWLEATDGPGATVRVFLSDHCKAFDLIDHSFLVTKLKQIKVPNISINWIIDFVSDRSQRVKLNKTVSPSGVKYHLECSRGPSWPLGLTWLVCPQHLQHVEIRWWHHGIGDHTQRSSARAWPKILWT